MPKGRHWYAKNPSDWIMGTKGLTLEENGAYGLVVDYLNERDRPLPDDDRIMAALLACSPQKWRKIRARLISLGKLVVQGDYITNPRFERERAERELTRAEAAEHGREGGKRSAELRQAELELSPRTRAHARSEPEIAEDSKKNRKTSANLLKNTDTLLTPVSQKTANEGQGYPQAPCARESQSKSKEYESLPTPPLEPARDIDDRMALLQSVCEAAGFHPTSPGVIDRSLRQVEAWMKLGVDFEQVVLPTIRTIIANDPEPTRTLGRFSKHIAHEHARRKAKTAEGKRYIPPRPPVLKRDDEPEQIAEMRAVLAQVLGPAFAVWFNDLRLLPDDDMPDRLNIYGRMAGPLMSSDTENTLRAVARRFGYVHVFAA